MNKIFNEDCNETLIKDISYDYVFCGPPDFNEIGLNPKTDQDQYCNFLFNIFKKFKPKNNTLSITLTDRKFNATILPKHKWIIDIMKSLGYKYLSQKIWSKSSKRNLYRLNYSIVMSFGKDKYKQNHPKSYEFDIWSNTVYKHKGYNYAMAKEVVERCILNFTNENEIVYDCFMGSGTTAIACLNTNRQYLGSEINKEFYELTLDRIKNSNE